MPVSNDTGKKLPANKQKGKKICGCCHEEKKLTDFYLSYSPMFSVDERTPVCKECCKKSALNDDGTINMDEFKELLMRCDKPLYYDDLSSAISSVKRENSYLTEEETKFHGYDILGKYFTLIAARQNRAKSYSDSEREGFCHQNSNKTTSELNDIKNQYAEQKPIVMDSKIDWTESDIKNMEYSIEVLGYDPFDEYLEKDRRFLFNQFAPYLEDDDVVDDTYKLSQILQIVNNNSQIDKCNKQIAILNPVKDAESIKTLNAIKKDLVMSNDKIAKENEISVKNRSNKEAGKSTLTHLMRDLRQKNFEKAEADYYDQLRSAGTLWSIEMSLKAIKQNAMLDENDQLEIYQTQLELTDKLYAEIDEKKEKIRILLHEIDKLHELCDSNGIAYE